MNINLRAILFGAAVSVAATVTMNVVAAESPAVIRLEPVLVTAHRAAFDADGNLKAERLEAAATAAR